MNQQQCKILYDFGDHLENMQISSLRRHFSTNIGFRIKHTKLPKIDVYDPLSSVKNILDTFKIHIS